MGRQRQWTFATRCTFFAVLPLLCVSHGVWALDATISGVSNEVEDNIQAYLQNIDAAQYTEVRLEGEIRRRAQEAMRVYGYYEPEITLERATDK